MASAARRRWPTLARVKSVYRDLGPYGRPHRKWLVRGSLAALGVVLARLAFPWPLRGIMELVLQETGSRSGRIALVPSWGDPIWWLAGAFVLVALSQGFAEYAQRVSFSRFAVGAVHDARAAKIKRLIKKAHRLDDSHPTGDVIARVIGDSARLKAGLKGVLVHVTQNGIFVVGVGAMLVLIDLRLGAVFVAGTAAAFAVAFGGASRVSRVARRYRKKEGALADTVHQALTMDGHRGRRVRKKALRKRALELKNTNRKSGSKDVRISRLQAQTAWAIHGVMALLAVAVLAIGIDGVSAGRLEVGDLFTVVAYLLLVHNPTVRMGRQTARLGKVLASAERLAAVRVPAKVKRRERPATRAGV